MPASYLFLIRRHARDCKFMPIKYMRFINIPPNIIFALNPQYKVIDLAE